MVLGFLDPELYRFSFFAIPLFATGFLVLILGCKAVVRERFSSTSVAFLFMTIPAAIWLFSFSAMYLCKNEPMAMRWAKIGYLGIPFIPCAIYYFTLKVLRLGGARKPALWIFLALSSASTATLTGSGRILKHMHSYPWGFYPVYEWPSPATAAYLLVFFGIMAWSLYHYWVEFRKPHTEIHRARVKYLFGAFCVAYLASTDFLPKFGVNFYPVGFLGVLCFLSIASFVIRRYRLVDVNPSLAVEKIMSAMGDMLLVLDSEDAVRIVNDSACHYLELKSSHIIGVPVSDLRLPLRETNAPAGEDRAYENTDDKHRVFAVSESFVRDPLGDVTAKVLVFRDITSFKKTLADLSASQDRCTELYNHASEPILVVDEFGRFFSVNQAAERLFDTTEVDLVGKIFVMSDLLPSPEMAKVIKAIHVVMDGGKTEPFPLELRKNGTILHLHATLSAVKRDERIIAVQFLLKDLAEEQRMEIAVKKAKQELLHKVHAILQDTWPQKDPELIYQKIKFEL